MGQRKGECLSCRARYQLPPDSQAKSFPCQKCGGLIVDADRRSPLFAKPSGSQSPRSALPARTETGNDRRPATRAERQWWPLVAVWSGIGVLLLGGGSYAWRMVVHRGEPREQDVLVVSESANWDTFPEHWGTDEPDGVTAATRPRAPAEGRQRVVRPAPAPEPVPTSESESTDAEIEDITSSVSPAAGVPDQPNPALASAAGPAHRVGAGTSVSSPGLFPFKLNAFDIDGQKLDLRTLKGNVAVVDLWGTWCPPCRQEIPNFVKLKETYGSSGLEIVGVNFERSARTRGDAIALVRNVRTQLGINYRCVLGNQTIARQVPDFGAFPTTLILDRNGQVRSKVVGYHSYEQLEELVKPLLGLGAGDP